MNIGLLYGQWAQNIGNAFFNIGGDYIFSKAGPPNTTLQRVMDQPNYRTLHNKYKGNPDNYWDPVLDLELDLIILQGPVLNSWLPNSWHATVRELRKKGRQYALHSCSFFKFTTEEFDVVKQFLHENPPKFISTRDHHAYEILKSWKLPCPVLNGIDAGFFVNRAYSPASENASKNWVAFNFDRYPEPRLENSESGEVLINNNRYEVKNSKFLYHLAAKGKVRAYLADLIDRRKLPTTLENLRVVRPEHRFFPHMTGKIYKRPHAFASDEPYTYLACYRGSALTLSDRVHACVATLSYGGSAMLFTPSPRAGLFERVGATNIRVSPQQISAETLHRLQEQHIEKIADVLT